MNTQEIKALIEAGLPGAVATVLTDDGHHFHAVVVSPEFEGKSRIQQHRMVNATLQAQIDSGALHAIGLTTRTPAEQAAHG